MLLLLRPLHITAAEHKCDADLSFTHELFSPRWEHGEGLTKQTLREIPTTEWQHWRRVPFAHSKSAENLDWEFENTQGMLDKTLSEDPRTKPDYIEVTTEHMSECTSCVNYDGLQAASRWKVRSDGGDATSASGWFEALA